MGLNLWINMKVNNLMSLTLMMTGKNNVKTEELKEEIIEFLVLKINMIHQVLLIKIVKKLSL
jgi:phosphoribosyl-dephospho-CoA transferase